MTNLYLYYDSIGASGAKEIAEALKVNKSMTNLDSGSNNIGDSGAKEFAEALKVNNSLTTLYFYENNIGDSGATEIVEALKVNKSLISLSLNSNNIGDSTTIKNFIQANVFYSQALKLISEKKNSADILELLKKASEIKPFDNEISNLIVVFQEKVTFKAKNEEEKIE